MSAAHVAHPLLLTSSTLSHIDGHPGGPGGVPLYLWTRLQVTGLVLLNGNVPEESLISIFRSDEQFLTLDMIHPVGLNLKTQLYGLCVFRYSNVDNFAYTPVGSIIMIDVLLCLYLSNVVCVVPTSAHPGQLLPFSQLRTLEWTPPPHSVLHLVQEPHGVQ